MQESDKLFSSEYKVVVDSRFREIVFLISEIKLNAKSKLFRNIAQTLFLFSFNMQTILEEQTS